MKLAGHSLDPEIVRPPKPETDPAPDPYQLLFDAAIEHAVQTEPELYHRFRAQIESLTEDPERPARVADLLKSYNTAVQAAVGERQSQVYSAIHQAFDTLKVVNQSDGEWTTSLDVLQDRLDKLIRIDGSATPDNIHGVRASFQEWLHGVRENLQQRKQASSQLLDSMRERVVLLEGLLDASVKETRATLSKAAKNSRADDVDPVTALGTKSAWERALANEMLSPAHLYVAAFGIESFSALSRRFGSRIAEQILFLASRHVSNGLKGPGDKVFRLEGPNFAALLRRDSSLPQVQHELHAISALKLEHEFALGGDGVAFVMAGLRARAFPAFESSVQDVTTRLAQFFLQ